MNTTRHQAGLDVRSKADLTIVRYDKDGRIGYGILEESQITAIQGDIFGEFVVGDLRFSLEDVVLLAPVEPRKVYGVGMNSHGYRQYRMGAEYPEADPAEPPVFEKSGSAITGPHSRLLVQEGMTGISGSPELAVIMKRRASGIAEDEVDEYILGYSASFDAMYPEVAIKDMLAAKDFPTSCPLGPWIKTSLDTSDLEVSLSVNGKEYHQGFTRDFIYDIPRVVSFLASRYVLEPGDVILMGAMGKEAHVDGKSADFVDRFTDLGGLRPVAYPKYQPGDRLVVRVQGVGELPFSISRAE
ncbi:MAG: fumarylacetoacetate hydrolase family protein [Rhodospirillaceae bacterium]|nr:fumarylacetoacetate hydrolase family protein [Rhodospirillaceae bacterium]